MSQCSKCGGPHNKQSCGEPLAPRFKQVRINLPHEMWQDLEKLGEQQEVWLGPGQMLIKLGLEGLARDELGRQR